VVGLGGEGGVTGRTGTRAAGDPESGRKSTAEVKRRLRLPEKVGRKDMAKIKLGRKARDERKRRAAGLSEKVGQQGFDYSAFPMDKDGEVVVRHRVPLAELLGTELVDLLKERSTWMEAGRPGITISDLPSVGKSLVDGKKTSLDWPGPGVVEVFLERLAWLSLAEQLPQQAVWAEQRAGGLHLVFYIHGRQIIVRPTA
jgi:hypothetical protein